MRWKIITVLSSLAFACLILTGLYFTQDSIVRFQINPRMPYETYTPPPAPNYQREGWALWASKPVAPLKDITKLPQAEHPVDIFYVHSTTYRSPDHWNAPISDAKSQNLLTKQVILNEAGPFTRIGAIYAPKYRQATLFSTFTQKHKGQAARKLAYNDVRTSFEIFIRQRSSEKPFAIVGYGQGGLHVQGLIADYLQDDPGLRRYLVAAYIIDHPTPADLFTNLLSKTPICVTPDDVRCVISWVAYEKDFGKEVYRVSKQAVSWKGAQQLTSVNQRPLVCVNPLSWSLSEEKTNLEDHKGAASATGLRFGEEPAIIEGTISSICQDGILRLSKPNQRYLRRPKYLGRQWEPLSYNIFYEDIRVNFENRTALLHDLIEKEDAFVPPIESTIEILDSPIHKVPK